MKIIGRMIEGKLFIQNSDIVDFLEKEFDEAIRKGIMKHEGEIYKRLFKIFEGFEKKVLTQKK